MNTNKQISRLAILLFVAFSSSTIPAQQIVPPGPVRAARLDQAELARQILSNNIEQRHGVLYAVEAIGPQNVGGELRAALIAALRQEATKHTQRYYAGRRGEASERLEEPEFIGRLSLTVAGLRDPSAIPVLAAAVFTGVPVARALADFGEQAAASVLQVVMSPDGWYDAVDGGLITLRFMIEGRDERPLTAGTVRQIRRVAEQRLTGEQYFTVLWRAIDLAAALGDDELRQIIKSLASEPTEVFARGVERADLIVQTQKIAADRLAGIPALPRP